MIPSIFKSNSNIHSAFFVYVLLRCHELLFFLSTRFQDFLPAAGARTAHSTWGGAHGNDNHIHPKQGQITAACHCMCEKERLFLNRPESLFSSIRNVNSDYTSVWENSSTSKEIQHSRNFYGDLQESENWTGLLSIKACMWKLDPSWRNQVHKVHKPEQISLWRFPKLAT